MKRILSVLLLCGSVWLANAQNKINRYEYWFDQNYSGKSSVSITAANQYTLSTSLATTGLENGLHTVNIRFRDDSLKWSAVVTQFFYKNGSGKDTVRKISQYQYWIDDDFQHLKTVAVSPGVVQYQLNGMQDMSAFSNGIHTLNLRLMDHTGFWSPVVTQFFYKVGVNVHAGSDNIVEAEYWVDQEFSNKMAVSIVPKNQLMLVSNLDASAYSNGIHVFNLRFKDGKGLWSAVVSSFFYKVEASVSAAKDSMVAAEYWVDDDFSHRTSDWMSPKNQWVFLKNLDVNQTSEGLHSIQIRFRDGKGMWSAVVSQFFYKAKPGLAGENMISEYRYWVDGADTAITRVVLPTPVNPYELAVNMDMTHLWKGIHQMHLQFKDTLGNWSVVLTDTFEKKSHPLALFDMKKYRFCDSGTVLFANHSVDFDSVTWDFGDGTISHNIHPEHQYAVEGKFAVKLWIADTTAKLSDQYMFADSVFIEKTPYFGFGKDTSACAQSGFTLQVPDKPGRTFSWNDHSTKKTLEPKNTGNYFCKVTTVLGCHWSDTIAVAIKPLAIPGFTLNINKTTVDFTDASQNASSLLWKFGDNVSSIQRNPTHSYPSVGVYTAWQIVQNSCNTDSISKTVQIVQSRVQGLENPENWVVYPNPFSDWCYLRIPETAGTLTVRVFASDGRWIQQTGWMQKPNMLEIDLRDVSDGVYRMEILDSNQRHYFTIVKQSK